MKGKIFFLLILVMLICSLSVGQVFALNINLEVSDHYILSGETFSIETWANNVFDNKNPGDMVLAFGFDVYNLNPSIVSFDSAVVGNLFNDDSAFLPDTDVAGSTFSGITDTDIHLATLYFTALKAGPAIVEIKSDTFDFNEGLVYLMEPDNIDITSSIGINVVPEANTCVLLLFGLVGIAGVKKKFRT